MFALIATTMLKVVDAPFVYNKCGKEGTYTSTHVLVGNARCDVRDALLHVAYMAPAGPTR